MDYDPFGQNKYKKLDNISGILKNMIVILDIVKISMEQKGYKGKGIDVNVSVVQNPITLIM